MKRFLSVFIAVCLSVFTAISVNAEKINTNKKWLVIGDSVSTISSTPSTYVANKYYDIIGEKTNLEVYAKNKTKSFIGTVVGGTGFLAESADGGDAIWQRVSKYPAEDFSLITIMSGFNDCQFSGTEQFGAVSDKTTKTLCGCANVSISLLKDKYPKAKIVVINEYYSPSRKYEKQLNLKNAFKQICDLNNVEFIDLLTPTANKTVSVPTFDGSHATAEGHETVANMILSKLLENNNGIYCYNDFGKLCEKSLYSFDDASGTLRISGKETGASFESTDKRPWESYKNKVNSAIVTGVSSIGKNTLNDMDSLKSLYISSSVSEISPDSFVGLNSLENLHVSGSGLLYDDCFKDAKNLCNIYISPNIGFGDILTGLDKQNLTIFGRLNSPAFYYAKSNGVKFNYSDINEDFVSDIEDVYVITKALSVYSNTQSYVYDTDVNNDGKTTLTDAVFVSRAVAGWDKY